MSGGPGRACPLHYRYRQGELAGARTLDAETAWVAGGLYGNPEALASILAKVGAERAAGVRAVAVFNGDFHWFDTDPGDFGRIQQTVLREHALAGNVELELASPDPEAGCGCAYPEFVDDATVTHSNRIIEQLRRTARSLPGAIDQLAALPRTIRVRVADCVTGVIHGDPESVAGWSFAIERVECPENPLSAQTVARWAAEGAVDAFACTHTCLPWAGRLGDVPVINNGSAGMPNFRGDPRAVVTRIAPAGSMHPDALYVEEHRGTRWEAVAIDYDTAAWRRRFERNWPEGSAARQSYAGRMRHGPRFDRASARPQARFTLGSGG